MTEKRFTDIWCSETGHIGITDNGIDKEFTGSEFEEFLNALHEENQVLKKQVKDMKQFVMDITGKYGFNENIKEIL